MKILQTLKYYAPSNGGTETVVKNIVEGISAIDSAFKFSIYTNNHIKSYQTISSTEKNISVLKVATPLHFRSQPLNFYYPSLKKHIFESDIIHHHYPFPNMELSLLRNKDLLKKKKFIITWHANIQNSRWGWIKKFYTPMMEKLLDLADHIVVTSPQLFSTSDILDKYQKKIQIIPLSFDPLFQFDSEIFRKFPFERPFKLLFVGKLRKYKGVGFLIEAIKNLNVNLAIIGDGEEERNLQEQVTHLNLSSRVKFYKNVDNQRLSEFYADADLFILPSINEAEAFGVVQLEAMASGMPVINTMLNSGVPYVSLNEVTGLTVPPKDVVRLQEAIARICNDPILYETFSKNCLERVKLFSREALAASYLKLYQS